METPDFIVKLLGLQGTDWVSCVFNFIGTILAVLAGSYFTIKLYNMERKDKNTEAAKNKEEDNVSNINILIMNIIDGVLDAETNYQTAEEQKNVFKENVKKEDRLRYSCAKTCDPIEIENITKKFALDLPSVMLSLHGLATLLDWANRYREQRNLCLTKDSVPDELYKQKIENEKDMSITIIRRLVPSFLVIYDYAFTKYGKEYTILKPSQEEFFKDIWKYLKQDLTKDRIELILQYKFKNKKILKWFFTDLKERYEKDKTQKDTEEKKDAE